jgi:uncharacterized protein (TIGR03435 family)
MRGQNPTSPNPAFEVATIKPAVPVVRQSGVRPHVGLNWNGDVADFGSMSLKTLIMIAFRVTSPAQFQGPTGLDEAKFDILAKKPSDVPRAQVPEMLQELLKDRFKLVAHREPASRPVYALIVDKRGLRIKQAPAGADLDIRYGRRLEFTSTFARLAEFLTPLIDRPILDKTGLTGVYQGAVDLTPNEPAAGTSGQQRPAAPAAIASSDPPRSPLFEALPQLGLNLESQLGAVDVVVVDHVERTPNEN